ncbi:MAG: hypothetical protein KA004_14870 [Verrucomicrobiales bacterium]|nr:hypothetical protein [Verrucomicrobiales bacterium]
MPRFFPAILCLLLAACSKSEPQLDPRSLETDAGEAVLRKLFADCPPKARAAKSACLVLGPSQMEASAEFQNRLANLGPRLLPHKDVTITGLSGKVRVHEKPQGNEAVSLVLLLQITEITGTPPNQKAVAAWAFKDSMMRRSYSIRSDRGTLTVSPGDIIEQKSGEAEK